jgi:hypothetical protein
MYNLKNNYNCPPLLALDLPLTGALQSRALARKTARLLCPYAACFGQSTHQRRTTNPAQYRLTLISRTFHSLIEGTAGSLFHWKYMPTTGIQHH